MEGEAGVLLELYLLKYMESVLFMFIKLKNNSNTLFLHTSTLFSDLNMMFSSLIILE